MYRSRFDGEPNRSQGFVFQSIRTAYRLLFAEDKAPSNLILVSGDRDYDALLVDYERQGRKVAVCFYQPINGGASIDLGHLPQCEEELILQRDIVLITFPFSDLASEKVRPAIVLSNDRYNRSSEDFGRCPSHPT